MKKRIKILYSSRYWPVAVLFLLCMPAIATTQVAGCTAGFDFSGASNYGPSIRVGAATAVPAGALKRIPIKFHILPRLNAAGAPDPANEATLNDIYADLNLANIFFQGSGLQFYMFGEPARINDLVLTNANVTSEHLNRSPLNPYVVANVINCFVVNRIDGPGGQNVAGGFAHLPYVGGDIILVTHGNMLSADYNNTLAHELGHYFGLLHTFHDPFYQTPCELVNGTNNTAAGDFIADTPADPYDPGAHGGAGNGVLDVNCNWAGNFRDANNQAYAPDTRNIMSYWNANGCVSDPVNAHFSVEQKQSMWARASRGAADNWGKGYLQIPCEAAAIVVNHNIGSNTILKSTADITIQGNIDVNHEVIVHSGTAIRINGINVRIRIAAVGAHRFVVTPCVAVNPVIAPGNTANENITAQPPPENRNLLLQATPNPFGHELQLVLPEAAGKQVYIVLYGSNGSVLLRKKIPVHGNTRVRLDTRALSAGACMGVVYNEKGEIIMRQKLVKQ